MGSIEKDGDSAIKSMISSHWDNWSLYYPDISLDWQGQREFWKKELRTIFGEGKLKILEIGAGTGEVSQLLAELGHDVTAVDISPGMARRAKENAEKNGISINFTVGDAENLQFGDDSFDAIINRHVFWTLPHPEKAVSEWIRCVGSGGKIVIIDGIWPKGPVFYVYKKFLKARLGLRHLISGHRIETIPDFDYAGGIGDKIPYVKHGLVGDTIVNILKGFAVRDIVSKDLLSLKIPSTKEKSLSKRFRTWSYKKFYLYHTYLVHCTVVKKAER